jgi:hypothetical protein
MRSTPSSTVVTTESLAACISRLTG